jgi:DNA (cytosine-5)-methyltransferase 1
MTDPARPGVYEFFAGGGMARAGLGEAWQTLFANDFDPMKGRAYAENWGTEDLRVADVHALTAADLPGRATLAWASSPCQDLSLAGRRGGLNGARSSAFFGFWQLMQALHAEGRAPPLLVIENVTGLFTCNGGADFTALCEVLAAAGYVFGAVELDAVDFTPQSRPRMFMIASRHAPAALADASPAPHLHSRRLCTAHDRLPVALKSRWRWWRMPLPPRRNLALADLLEPDADVAWRSDAETARLLELLSPLQRLRLDQIISRGERTVGALFRRTRMTPDGRRQRAEVRFDGLAGCLRTSGGGSSRQFLLVVEDGCVRSRQMTAREAARLMGLPDSYRLPPAATTALHLVGDGVAVPVVRWLSEHLLLPLAGATTPATRPMIGVPAPDPHLRPTFAR